MSQAPIFQQLVQLAVGMAIVFASLAALQVVCLGLAALTRFVEKRFMPASRTAPAVPTEATSTAPAMPASSVQSGPELVRITDVGYLDRKTLLSIIEQAVAQAFPGKTVRVLSYGLPRIVEAGGWSQLGKQTHFGSRRIR